MVLYRTNEITFSLPDFLEDRTRHVFCEKREGSGGFTLTITRRPLLYLETFPQYCERLLSELQGSLRDFQLRYQRSVVVAGQPSFALDYRWRNNDTWIHQRQINVHYISCEKKQMALQIMGSVSDCFSDENSKMFIETIGSIALNASGEV